MLFFTDLGYDIQKYVSPAAFHVDFGFGSDRQFLGVKASFGVPQVIPLSYRYNVGAAYYWSDYDNMYSGWEISHGGEWGVNAGPIVAALTGNPLWFAGAYVTSSCTFYDREGTEYDQYRDVIKIGNPFINLQIENDTKDLHLYFLPGMPKHEHSDKYMTSEIRLRVGLFEFGSTLVTGNTDNYAVKEGDGLGPNGTREGNDYSAGILYMQLGPIRIGYNSEDIRDAIQNGFHDIYNTPRVPIDKKKHPNKWYWEINF